MFYAAIKGASAVMRGGGGIEGGSKIDARSINSATLTSLIAHRPSSFLVSRTLFYTVRGGEGREAKISRNCSSRCRSSTCSSCPAH